MATAATAVLARQPIFDREGGIYGFELLYRPSASALTAKSHHHQSPISGDDMTREVVFAALSLGLERLVGDRWIFCNADYGVLAGRIPLSLPPASTVIEILETVPLNDEIVSGCVALKDAGFALAADDYAPFPGDEVLLDLVDFVKVDLRKTPLTMVADIVKRCRSFNVTMLAEKVETSTEYRAVLAADFDLFQGFHLAVPETISGPAVHSSRAGTLRLATAVLDENVNYNTLEHILRTEPILSYQILQLAAIGRFGETSRKVSSLRQALVYIGLNQIRGFIPALLLRGEDDIDAINLTRVLSRARLVELLTSRYHPHVASKSFTAAMVAGLDILLDVPPAMLPQLLDLPAQLRYHAFDPDSPIRGMYDTAHTYDKHGKWPAAIPLRDHAAATDMAREAKSWAVQATDSVAISDPH